MTYFIVGLIATTLGAIAGLGGGVIIKPVLDALGHYDLGSIGILSSATVFSMAVVSLVRAIQSGTSLNGKLSALIATGSIAGGIAGKAIFRQLILRGSILNGVKTFQSLLLAALMVIVLILFNNRDKIHTRGLKNPIEILAAGMALGLISAFLGIGGGPLNVAILTIFFKMDSKAAVIHSILIIFFSQAAGLAQVALTTGFSVYQLDRLVYMIPGGILGGLVGSRMARRVNINWIRHIFNSALVLIVCLNLFNAFSK